MKSFFQKYNDLLWSLLFLVFAFIFSAKLPPYIGVFVFVVFFTLSVAMVKKFLDGGKGED